MSLLRLLSSVSACLIVAGLQAAHARTLTEIRGEGSLRICVAGSSAAFYQANGEAFARYLGVKPAVKQLLDWDLQFQNGSGVIDKEAAYEARVLADGSCDVLPNDLHIVDWRESKMLMVPYYSARKVIIVHRDLQSVIKRPADLAGRSAAVQKGTAYETWLARQNQTVFSAKPVLITFAPTAECMKQVAGKSVDFTVVGTEGAYRWVRSQQRDLVMLFPVDEPVAVGWGLSPAAGDLAGELRSFFNASRRAGSEMDLAWEKQYNVSLVEYEKRNAPAAAPTGDAGTLPAGTLPAGAAAVVLLIAVFGWNFYLRRELGRAATLHALVENATSGIIVRDREFGLLNVNRAFLDFIGYTRDELMVTPAFALADPDGREEVAGQFAKLRSGEIGHYRTRQRFRLKGGESRVADMVVSGVRNRAGDFIGTITIVTEQRAQP